MKKFLLRIFYFFLPLFLFFVLYVVVDPFKVIMPYKEYLSEYVMLHRGFVSTKVYLSNIEDQGYDSFIFGSSRSCSHTSKKWEEFLPEKNVPFSYGSWNEPIEGIYKKLKLINDIGRPIKNAFIVIDGDRTFVDGGSNTVAKDHFLVSGKSWFSFHWYYFTQYLDLKMIVASIDYSLFKTRRGYMDNFVGMKTGDIDPVNNDWLPKSEEKIVKDSVGYYKKCLHKFYKRPEKQTFYKKNIGTTDKEYLIKIKGLFEKHNTDYHAVIAPLYDQKKLHFDDKACLDSVFGSERVHDYSGINSITDNVYNYGADVIHYRKRVGDLIFREIYGK